jgi:hypothetical protein
MFDTEAEIEKLIVNCATCGRALGDLTRDGWVWKSGTPCRLVNRRRFITSVAVHEEPPSAPWDDFRMRGFQRDRFEKAEYSVWEYPYTCDSDECMAALGPEWEPVKGGPGFQVMPPGRVLS